MELFVKTFAFLKYCCKAVSEQNKISAAEIEARIMQTLGVNNKIGKTEK